ncbi:MAG TPA: PEGA domain-containing protein [Blastocatellia bacterium]|nr:PEGA domain-containing protein [Blastocatellia bacterium]
MIARFIPSCSLFRSLFQVFLLVMALAAVGLAQDPSGRPTDPPKKDDGKKGGRPPRSRPDRPPINLETVILTIITDPPGSTIFINGENRGETNAEGRKQFDNFPWGYYSIEVRKEGYFPLLKRFHAGGDVPTLVFKLTKNFDEESKKFDELVAAGKLAGPESPNALELYSDLAGKFPGRPEIARMRAVLAGKLMEKIPPVIERTVYKFREVTRDELAQTVDLAAKALTMKPDDKRLQAEAAYLKGIMALREVFAGTGQPNAEAGGGLQTAQAELEKAAQLQPNWSAAQYYLGFVLLRMGNSAGAEAAYLKVTQLEPSWDKGHIGLGMAYLSGGKHREAIDAFGRALALESGNAVALAGRGLARTERGEKKGVEDLQRAAQLNSASGLPNFYLGMHLAKSKSSKDRLRAVEELKKAIQKNPDNFEFQNSAAQQIIAELEKNTSN